MSSTLEHKERSIFPAEQTRLRYGIRFRKSNLKPGEGWGCRLLAVAVCTQLRRDNATWEISRIGERFCKRLIRSRTREAVFKRRHAVKALFSRRRETWKGARRDRALSRWNHFSRPLPPCECTFPSCGTDALPDRNACARARTTTGW